MSQKLPAGPIDDALLEYVRARLAGARSVRRKLAPAGEIAIERPLPFLIVHRTAGGGQDDEVPTLVRGQASFIEAPIESDITGLVSEVIAALSNRFGGVLVLELWAGLAPKASPDQTPCPAGFRVHTEPEFSSHSTVRTLVNSLKRVQLYQQPAEVSLEFPEQVAPSDARPLITRDRAKELNVTLLGLEIRPVYRDAETGEIYPVARRNLTSQLGKALRRTAFEFARIETRHRARHFEALGRRSFTKLVWEIDRTIASISQGFDLLLSATPVNGDSAYREFESSGFKRSPNFLYRPRTIDPPLLKRELYQAPIERVSDPTLSFLFEEKRRELDLKLTMIEELHTRRFLPTSLALYGTVDSALVQEAKELLSRFQLPAGRQASKKIDASTFALRAEALLARLRDQAPGLASSVELRDDVTSLTVSSGNLLVGKSMTFSEDRADALLQHEVGTHVVTHWNGRQQPLSILSAGLAGYDELQEGLAVFAEYLVGGLSILRLRTLAGRVVAARSMSEGASFVDTFRELTELYDFGPRAAYTNAMRVHRGGGFVKDAVYLRGLRAVLEFVQRGGKLETLFIGKVSTDHAEMIEELQERKILKPLALLPTYLRDAEAQKRLGRARNGLTLEQLVEP